MNYSGKCRKCNAYIQVTADRSAKTYSVSKLIDPLHEYATRDNDMSMTASEKIRTECPFCGVLTSLSR